MDSVSIENQPALRASRGTATQLRGFWSNRLAPFLEQHFFLLCFVLISVAALRVVATYNALSVTTDEPDDYVSAVQYWTNHTYTFSIAHPPLSRITQGLGPYLLGARLSNAPPAPGSEMGTLAATGHPAQTIFLMRLGNLPFYLIGCLAVCGLAWFAFGKPVAVLATLLFTSVPETLANAGLATTDTALGANVAAAFLAVILWAQKPTWFRAVMAGVFTGFAALSKLTALGFVPMCLGLALVCYLAVERPGLRTLWSMFTERIAGFVAAAAIAGFSVWAAYWFAVGSFYSNRLHRNLRIPAPTFFTGIHMALSHNSVGHGSYLLGHFNWHGWWYYFPVALVVKTPIALIVLGLLGLTVSFRNYRRAVYLLSIAFTLGILLPSLRGHIDIGIRHIEPIWIGISLLGALGLKQLLEWNDRTRIAGIAAGLLVAWMVVSVGVQHPDYLGYFNAFAGREPEHVLVDSNYDWGQDLKPLAGRLRQLGVEHIALAGTYDAGNKEPAEIFGAHNALLQSWYGLPPIEQVDACAPLPGWNVVSTSVEKSLSYWPQSSFYRGSTDAVEWYEQIAPTERVGPLLLFNIPPGSSLHSSNCKASAN